MVKGEQAHLQCSALGDTPMEMMWKMGSLHIVPDSDPRFTIREQVFVLLKLPFFWGIFICLL